jgi:Cu/Ag efflux protein CusF
MVAAAVGGLWGCAPKRTVTAPTPPPVAASGTATSPGQVTQVNTVQLTATVVDVDSRRRRVSLRGSDGVVETFRVGPDVRNLAQVRRGDQVVATYVQALELRLRKKGTASPGVTEDVAFDRNALGQMPGAAGGQAVTVTARITAIDRATQMVTLKGPKGRTVRIHVKDPTHLENARVGDLVEATYIEAVALEVERTGVGRRRR